MKAILIILAIAVCAFGYFMFAWFLGKLIHFCMNDEKEGKQRDHDAQ